MILPYTVNCFAYWTPCLSSRKFLHTLPETTSILIYSISCYNNCPGCLLQGRPKVILHKYYNRVGLRYCKTIYNFTWRLPFGQYRNRQHGVFESNDAPINEFTLPCTNSRIWKENILLVTWNELEEIRTSCSDEANGAIEAANSQLSIREMNIE